MFRERIGSLRGLLGIVTALAIALIASYLAAMSFLPDWRFLPLTLPPAFVLLAAGWLRWRQIRRRLFSREQFKWFLELLLTRLSAGSTLENAICGTVPDLAALLGGGAAFMRSLRRLDQQLRAHQPLERVMPVIASRLTCREAAAFFRIMPDVQKSGCNLPAYVRQHLRMISEQLALQQDVGAETTQRQTEALLLTVMPFAMAFMIRRAMDSVTLEAMQQPTGIIGTLVAFAIALIAAMITFASIGLEPDRRPNIRQRIALAPTRRFLRPIIRVLIVIYRDGLPETYGSRLLQLLQAECPADTADQVRLTERYFARKTILMLGTLILAGLILASSSGGQAYFLLLVPAVSWLQDRQIFNKRQQKLSIYRLEYPVFLNLCSALLQAGLSMHKTLRIGSSCLHEVNSGRKARHPGKAAVLSSDLEAIRLRLETGRPPSDVLTELAASCPLPEAQAALLLMLRYEQSGGQETLNLLSMQAGACWSLYRTSVRRQMEQQAVRLILPMMLDLIAVLLVSLLPAVLSLQAI